MTPARKALIVKAGLLAAVVAVSQIRRLRRG